MREIDFLPEWYKSGRRRKVTYRTQYIVLAGMLAIMIVWNFAAAHSIAKAEAELTRITAGNPGAQAAALKFARLKEQIGNLQRKDASIQEIDSRIDVASVLAELSFLIDRPIVLAKVEFIAEKFAEAKMPKTARPSGALVRAARSGFNEKGTLPLGDVRFKVVIGGLAADAGDVAALICKLEDSPYFCQVVPLFSRNTRINPEAVRARSPSDIESSPPQPAREIVASEFEISCYLANYRRQ